MSSAPQAACLHSERWYQERWCPGVTEHVLPDRTRVDCLTDTHAWEVDFASKWYQALGQSLWYAAHSARRAGMALIVKREGDRVHVRRARAAVAHYGLPVDVIELGE